MKVEINKRKAAPKIPDRIDIHCEVQAVPFAELSQMQPGEPSEKSANVSSVPVIFRHSVSVPSLLGKVG